MNDPMGPGEGESRGTTGQAGAPPHDLDPSISVAAERIETIIDAAARAASGIRTEAHVEAELYLEEAEREADRLAMRRIRLMSELTDSLIEQAERMREQSDELVRALEDAMRSVAAMVTAPRSSSEPEREGGD